MNIFHYFRLIRPTLIYESHPGRHPEIVITGGLDGDELAGIMAAKELIRSFKDRPPHMPVVIIPILNQAGFKRQVDYNPDDGKYPKYIYPGLGWGSASQRLMWWLHAKYVLHSNLWIDLHSGNRVEDLFPFIWLSQASSSTTSLLSESALPLLHTNTLSLVPSAYLNKKGIGYILIESGSRGRADDRSVKTHVTEVLKIIGNYQMPSVKNPVRPTFTAITYRYANKTAAYTFKEKPGEVIEDNQTILWQHAPGTIAKDELLLALGK